MNMVLADIISLAGPTVMMMMGSSDTPGAAGPESVRGYVPPVTDL